MKKIVALTLSLVILFGFAAQRPAAAQETAETLTISLSRDFGTSIANRISGTFSIRVSNPPEAITRVVFQLNGETIGEDTAVPFRLQFRTTNYEPGPTAITAIGYAADGSEVAFGTINRTFMSSSESGRTTAWIIIPILVLAIGGRLLANWIANRNNSGKPAATGMLGGAICTNCGRPFAFHVWSINLAVWRIDRCPHCGNWVRVTRASDAALREAAAVWEDTDETAVSPSADTPTSDTPEDIQRRLDDSRFDN